MATYVIQVMGGREDYVRDLMGKLANDMVEDCFVPRREVLRREGGAWVSVTETLFPGYLFVVTNKIEEVSQRLARIPAFTRLLGKSDERIVPLSPDEVSWLDALLESVTKVMGMSVGVIEGDRVMVTDGPLKGHEALIRKINRYKRVAYLDMRMFGRTKTIKVGLEIVRKNS